MPSNSGRTPFDLDREHAIRDAEAKVVEASEAVMVVYDITKNPKLLTHTTTFAYFANAVRTLRRLRDGKGDGE